MFMTGEDSMPPIQMGNFLVGQGASAYAAVGTLAALHNRLFTNEGEHVDVSMQECAASWLDVAYSSYKLPPYRIYQRLGSRALLRVPSQVYPCRDGHFFLAGMGRWNLVVAWMVDKGIDVGDFADKKYEAEGGVQLLWDALPKVTELIRELGMKYTKTEIMNKASEGGYRSRL